MNHPFGPFVRRFLATGAIGVSLGLAAVSVTPVNESNKSMPDPQVQPSFSARLHTVRSAVSASNANAAGSGTKRAIKTQFRNVD